MYRRALLAGVAVALAGCEGVVSEFDRSDPTYDERPVAVSDWTEATTVGGEPYSAVWAESLVEDPPNRPLFIGRFDSGAGTVAADPADPAAYGDHGSPIYDHEGVQDGWLVFPHPEDAASSLRLTAVEFSDWEWTRE